MRSAGFDSERLTAHSLRHTAITLSLLAGASLQEVQQFARHSSIDTTQIYAHNLECLDNPCNVQITAAIFN
jgi:site-specific recombinase XerD